MVFCSIPVACELLAGQDLSRLSGVVRPAAWTEPERHGEVFDAAAGSMNLPRVRRSGMLSLDGLRRAIHPGGVIRAAGPGMSMSCQAA